MRVHELAQALGIPAKELITQLRSEGEWVQSHLSAVPDPVTKRYLPLHTKTVQAAQRGHAARNDALRGDGDATLRAGRPVSAKWPRFKRQPGPRPFTTRQQPGWDEYEDPIESLRYEPQITTRDVASLFGVSQAAVRRWVARGHIKPVGRLGVTNLFNTGEVLTAYDEIEARRKATSQPRRQDSYRVELRPIDRIRPKHHDAVVSIGEAARIIGVSAATIRSWIHRGHLKPLASSTPKAVQLRLGDAISAAHGRRLPTRAALLRRRRSRQPG